MSEAITMVQALTFQSPDIQKVLAFEGAFEKLFNTVTQEGGVDGGLVAQGALTCVDGLLRFNSSNQVSLVESTCWMVLPILFPRAISVKPRYHQCFVPSSNFPYPLIPRLLHHKNLPSNFGTIKSEQTHPSYLE
jgi:hypothetical protein